MDRYQVRIDISGCPGSGKSTLLQLIGHCLKTAGFNVECQDEGQPGIVSEDVSSLLDSLREIGPRQSLVSVCTHDVRSQDIQQLGGRPHAPANSEWLLRHGLEQPVEVGGMPRLVEGANDIVAGLHALLGVALRHQQAAQGEQVAQRNGDLGAVGPLDQ